MNQFVSVYLSKQRRRFLGLCHLVWVVVFLLVAACGGGTPTATDSQALLSGQAVVTCTDQCAARGQCGVLADGQQAVLGNSFGPDTLNHDRLFIGGTAVNVVGSEVRVVQSLANAEQRAQLPFYALALPDNSKIAWVAGWCVASP